MSWHRALIDDPDNGEPRAERIRHIERLGSAGAIDPVRKKEKPTAWDLEFAELIERQRAEWLKS